MPVFSDTVQGVSLSDALKEAATYAPAERTVLVTYEFTHSTFVSRALIVVAHDGITAVTEENDVVDFVPVAGLRHKGFDESDEGSTPTIGLYIDGLSQELVDKLDLALQTLEPVGLVERVYVSDDLSGPALLPPARAYIRSGSVTETRVTLEAGFGDPVNQPYPRKTYSRKEHPGLSV